MNLASKILIVSSLLALGALPTPALASFSPKTPPSQGLVGWWTFDSAEVTDKIYDRSGKANNGYFFNGATSSAKVAGTIGQAMRFDGSDDYVSIPDANPLDVTSAITISAWVKPISFGANAAISLVSKRTAGDEAYLFDILASNSMLRFHTSIASVQSTTAIQLGVWQHVAVSWNGSNATFYINGVSAGAPALSGTLATNAETVRIGNVNDGTFPEYMNGLIDDVRIYNRALSVAEIAQLYRSTQSIARSNASQSGKATSGLIGLWTFDSPDIAGVTAYDRSGQGNNGTLTNGPTRALGRMGQALQFNGTNNSVQIPNQDRSTFTAATWIRRTGGFGTNDSQRIIMGGSSGWGWYIQSTDTMEFGKPGVSAASPRSTTAITDSKWHHIAATYDGATVRYYLDGVADGSASYAVSFNNGGGAYALATDPTFGGFLNGLMDETRIYNRVLSPDEIKRLYNKGSATKSNVASPSSNSLTNGLVGYWDFDNKNIYGTTAYDKSGQGNNGTLTNGPTRALGRLGQALSFNGSSNYVAIGDSDSLDVVTSMTVGAWVKLGTSPSNYPTIVCKPDSDDWTPEYAGYCLRIFTDAPNAGKFEFFLNDYLNTRTYSTTIPSVGTWYHVVATYDNANVKIYVNGVLEATSNVGSGKSRASVIRLGIGARVPPSAVSEYWNGSIDDVRIYNRALSEAEIKRLYNQGR